MAGISVNSRIRPIPVGIGGDGKPKLLAASVWLDQNAPVEQMTWVPGEPQIIHDRLISDGGWFSRPGCAVFNLYRPPTIRPCCGDPSRWVDHACRVFKDDTHHIIKWLAHRVQRPQEKINHALVLGGLKGSARTPCSNRSSTRSGPGTSARPRRNRSWAGSTGF